MRLQPSLTLKNSVGKGHAETKKNWPLDVQYIFNIILADITTIFQK